MTAPGGRPDRKPLRRPFGKPFEKPFGNPIAKTAARGFLLLLLSFSVGCSSLRTFFTQGSKGTHQNARVSGDNSSNSSASPSDPSAQAVRRIDRPFVWKAQRGERVIYLLGTMHMQVKAKRALPSCVLPLIAESQLFFTELADLDQVASDSLVQKAFDRSQPSLVEVLGAQRWQALRAALGEQFPAQMLEIARPWYVCTLLATRGLEMSTSMDKELFDFAKEQGIETRGLETLQDQLTALQSLCDEQDLKTAIDEMDRLQAQQEELIEAYYEGNGERVWSIYQGSLSLSFDRAARAQASEKALLHDRNKAWLKVLLELETTHPKSTRVFLAVGLLHLLGEASLNRLLEEKGFSLERLELGAARETRD